MAGEPLESRDTREFAALWSETVEGHLTHQLTQILPGLVGEAGPMDPARTATVARHLVHALRLTALSGDAVAGVNYLAGSARAADDR